MTDEILYTTMTNQLWDQIFYSIALIAACSALTYVLGTFFADWIEYRKWKKSRFKRFK